MLLVIQPVVWYKFMISIPLQDYQEKPDYGRCVAIVASASLREMIKPGALAIISPIVIGRFLLVY